MLLDDFVVLNYVLVVFNLSKIDYLSFNLKILKLHFYFSWFQYKDFCHSEESFGETIGNIPCGYLVFSDYKLAIKRDSTFLSRS